MIDAAGEILAWLTLVVLPLYLWHRHDRRRRDEWGDVARFDRARRELRRGGPRGR